MPLLPTARHLYSSDTPEGICERHNRLSKALEIACELYVASPGSLTARSIDRISNAEMAAAARDAGVNIPNSEATRDTVRYLLHTFHTLLQPTGHAKRTLPSVEAQPADITVADLATMGVPVLLWPLER
ncbi:hypothetical protein [Streptomyces luteireticuli]|uniref:hypothetical protein n=1 Tax=Streptomyces luteireticuli TaxID=173858 RepID=UPI003556A0C7